MLRKLFSVLLVVCCLMTALPAMAEEVTQLEFYFPVVVGGALQQQMQQFVDEFNAAHPEYNIVMI